MAGEMQGHQLLIEKEHPSFHSKERDSLNTKFDLLERFLDVPFRVDYQTPPVVTISGSEVALTQSNGLQGELSDTAAIFTKSPQPDINHEEIVASTLNLFTGNATGAFESSTPYSPIIPANYYVWVGVEMIGNKWFVRWGMPASTSGAATKVAFSQLARRKLFTVICHKNGVSGTWGLSAAIADFVMFESGGGSGSSSLAGEGGDDYLITRYQMNFLDLLETSNFVDASETTGEYTFVDEGKVDVDWSIRSFTKVGNALTLALAPSFTMVPGDVVRQGDAFAKITVVTTQTSITVDDASLLTNGKATFSQVFTTKDLLQQDGPNTLYQVDKTDITHLSVRYTDTRSLFCQRDAVYVAATKSGVWSPIQTNPPNTYKAQLSEVVYDPGDAGANMFLKFFASAQFDGVPVTATGVTPANVRVCHGFLANTCARMYEDSNTVYLTWYDPDTLVVTNTDTFADAVGASIFFSDFYDEYCVVFVEASTGKLARRLFYSNGNTKGNIVYLDANAGNGSTLSKIGQTVFDDLGKRYVTLYERAGSLWWIDHTYGISVGSAQMLYNGSVNPALWPRLVYNEIETKYIAVFYAQNGIWLGKIDQYLVLDTAAVAIKAVASLLQLEMQWNLSLATYGLAYRTAAEIRASVFSNTTELVNAQLYSGATVAFDFVLNADRNEYALLLTTATVTSSKTFDPRTLVVNAVLSTVNTGVSKTDVGLFYDARQGQYLVAWLAGTSIATTLIKGDTSLAASSGIASIYDYKVYFRLNAQLVADFHWQAAINSDNTNAQGDGILDVQRNFNGTGRTLITGIPTFNEGTNPGKPFRDFFLAIGGKFLRAGASNDYVIWNSNSVLLTYDLPVLPVENILVWRNKGSSDDSEFNRNVLGALIQVVVSDVEDVNFFQVPQQAIDECPNNGWILVDKMCDIRSTLSVSGKSVNFLFRGQDTGFVAFPGTNEVQLILFSATPNAGTWTITYGANTTASMTSAATAVTVQAALQALPGTPAIVVTGNFTNGFTLSFTGNVGKSPQTNVVVNSSLLFGVTPVVATVSKTTAGESTFTGNCIQFVSAPNCQLVGLGLIQDFATGIQSNSNPGLRIEMAFVNNTTPIDYGTLQRNQFSIDGSLGLDIDQEDIPFNYDVRLTNRIGFQCYPTASAAFAACPAGGWILVEKKADILSTIIPGKRVNVMCKGTGTGFRKAATAGRIGFQMSHADCQFLGMGEFDDFDVAVDLNDLTGTRIEMRFPEDNGWIYRDDFSMDTTSKYSVEGAVVTYDAINDLMTWTYQAGANHRLLWNTVPLTAGRVYWVKFRAKSVALTGQNLSFTGFGTYADIVNPALTASFQDYEFTLTATSAYASLPLFTMLVGAIGNPIDIDNVRIQIGRVNIDKRDLLAGQYNIDGSLGVYIEDLANDVVVTDDRVGENCYVDPYTAMEDVRDGGRVVVEKLCVLNSTLTTRGKRVDIICKGPETGFLSYGGTDAIQKVTFSAIPDGGTWKLEFGGQKTVDMSFSTNAAGVEAALEALSNIANVTVSGDYSIGFTVEWVGVDGLQPKAMLTIPAGINEIQHLNFATQLGTSETTRFAMASGLLSTQADYFTVWSTSGNKYAVWLNINGAGTQPTGADYASTPIGNRVTVNILSADNPSQVATKVFNAVNGVLLPFAWTVNSNVVQANTTTSGATTDALTHNANDSGTGSIVATITQQGTPQIYPISGSFRLKYGANESANIPFTSNAASVQAVMESVPSIGVGNILVTGDYYAGFDFQFIGTKAARPVLPLLIPDGTNEIQHIVFSTVPTSGNWRLAYNGQNTNNMNWNATANDVRGELVALTTIDNVIVTGSYSGGFFVEFIGTIDGKKPALAITVNANTLLTGVVPVNITISVTQAGNYPGDNLYSGLAGTSTLTLKDSKGSAARGSWGDGTYVYSCQGTALIAYTVSQLGVLTAVATYTGVLGNFLDVIGDGTYIYASTSTGYLVALQFNGTSWSLVSSWNTNNYTTKLTIAGSHLVAVGADGVASFRVVTGVLTRKDFLNPGPATGCWGNGNYAYVTFSTLGIRSYSINPVSGALAQIATDLQGADTYYAVWGDNAYLHVACDNYMRVYSYNYIAGTLTYVSNFAAPVGDKYRHIWGDNLGYLYVGGDSAGVNFTIFQYTTTYIVAGTSAIQALSVWHDNTFLYMGTATNFRTYLWDLQNHIWQNFTIPTPGEWAGDAVTIGGLPISLAVTEIQAGTIPFASIGLQLDKPYCTVTGLGKFENFATALDLNGNVGTRIESFFKNNTLAVDYSGLLLTDFNIAGSQGSPFSMDDGVFHFDTVISNAIYQGHPYTTFVNPQDAIDACPDGGFILVNKMTVLTVGLDTNGKTIHFVFRGPETGFDGNSVVGTGITFDAPGCSMTGYGLLENFTAYAIDFNAQTRPVVQMIFGTNGPNRQNINYGTLRDYEYNVASCVGLVEPSTAAKQTVFPIGFVEAEIFQSVLDFDDVSQTLSVTPAPFYTVYVQGVRKEIDVIKTAVVPNISGLYWIWFDDQFDLQVTNTPWDLSTDAPVAVVLWNANKVAGKLGDERHGVSRIWKDHMYKHLAFGTQYINGHSIFGYTLTTPSDAAITFGLTSGRVADEDIFLDLYDTAPFTSPFHQNIADPAQLEIWYRENTVTGAWTWDATTGLPIKHLVGVPQWSDPASNFAQTPVTSTYFFNVWVLTTNFQFGTTMIIQPQSQHATQADAEAEDFDTLQFGGFPAAEMAALYRITYQYVAASGGTTNCHMAIEPLDIRGTKNPGRGAGGGAGGANHNSLSGRSDPNSHPATAISTEVSQFATTAYQPVTLGASQDEVQKSLVKLSDRGDTTTQMIRQNANKKLRGGGNITWSGTQLTTAASMYVEMEGLGDTRNTILALTNFAIADGYFIYVTVNRTGAAAANLTVIAADTVPFGDDILVLGRRLGSKLWLENIVLRSGQIGSLDLFTTDDKEFRYDCVVTDTDVYGNRYATTQAAITACPAGGWILVEKSEALTVSLTTGKQLNFMFKGASSGWTNNGAGTAITTTANNNQFVGRGTISGFTNGINLGATTGNSIDMVFSGNTTDVVGTGTQFTAHRADTISTKTAEFATTANESTALTATQDEVQKSLVKLSDRSDWQTQAIRQNANKKLRGGGNITWSGTQLSTASVMYVEIEGLLDTRNAIQPLTTFSIADGYFIYVTVNRTGTAGANLTVVAADTVPFGDDILIIGRRLGSKLWLENIVLRSGQIGNLDLFTTDDKEFRYDCVVTDTDVYGNRYATTQAAINACPSGGWILVEKSEALTASLTTGSKILNFMFKGASSGWSNSGAVTAITMTANGNQFLGLGTISGFTTGIALGATTNNRISMIFSGNTTDISGSGTIDQYDATGSFGATGFTYSYRYSNATPTQVSSNSTGAQGSALTVSRSDHQHGCGTHTHADSTTGSFICQVPLGAVIAIVSVAAWALPGANAIKDGYALCNGQNFPVGSNAAFGAGAMPNLSDSRFLQGNTAANIATTGGNASNQVNLAHTHSVTSNVVVGDHSSHTHTQTGHYHKMTGAGATLAVDIAHTHSASTVTGTVDAGGTHTHAVTNGAVATSTHTHGVQGHYHSTGSGSSLTTNIGHSHSLGTTNVGGSGSAASGGVDHSHQVGGGAYNFIMSKPSGGNTNFNNGGGVEIQGSGATDGASAYNHTHSVSVTTNIDHSHTLGTTNVTASGNIGKVTGGVSGDTDGVHGTSSISGTATVTVNSSDGSHSHTFSSGSAVGQTLGATSKTPTGSIGNVTSGNDGDGSTVNTGGPSAILSHSVTNNAVTSVTALSATQDIRPLYINVVYVMRVV